jgi:hypothetical protein
MSLIYPEEGGFEERDAFMKRQHDGNYYHYWMLGKAKPIPETFPISFYEVTGTAYVVAAFYCIPEDTTYLAWRSPLTHKD